MPSKEMLLEILNASPIAMLLIDKQANIIFTNQKLNSLFHYDLEELTSQPISCLIPDRYRQAHNTYTYNYIHEPQKRAMADSRVLKGLVKGGDEIEIKIGLSFIDVEGQQYSLATIIEVDNKILKLAIASDPLTGLHNRKLFIELSENLHRLAIRKDKLLTIMFIDLDGFKSVNDQLGHAIGDTLLCDVARALRRRLRANDIIARYGGDEFVMCFYGLKNDEIIKNVADKIINEIASINEVAGVSVSIGASVGVFSTNKPSQILLSEMINYADKLMYKAKNEGKGAAMIENLEKL